MDGDPEFGLRLVSSNSSKPPDRVELGFEQSTNRLREALAILQTIEQGELLDHLDSDDARDARRRAVSLLAVLQRELKEIIAAQDRLLLNM